VRGRRQVAASVLEIAKLTVIEGERYPLFAEPITVSALADPGDRLIAFLGRRSQPKSWAAFGHREGACRLARKLMLSADSPVHRGVLARLVLVAYSKMLTGSRVGQAGLAGTRSLIDDFSKMLFARGPRPACHAAGSTRRGSMVVSPPAGRDPGDRVRRCHVRRRGDGARQYLVVDGCPAV
jgi:hypothetical protein